ncbi:hypothetical protein G3I78_50800, partial [Streptomyces sp. SID13726]|nr:hypothetical protein [Streptomyces sp. SID13726]
MPYEPAIRHPEPITPDLPTTLVSGALLPAVPAGADVRLVTLPDGTRTLAYTHPTPIEPAPAPAPRTTPPSATSPT